MIDSTIREATGEVISGDKNDAELFTELWKFVRAKHGWVLDEIDQDVEIIDFLRMKSARE